MVDVRDVSKSYGKLKAVDGVSFQAKQGEIFGLIGPNGAGKSTTIRMIMNIIAPDSGDIDFDGHRLSELDKPRIGYLPEERGLYRKVKVNDMLIYLGNLKGASTKELQPRIDDWLGRFGLTEWKQQKISELSKGMSQKIQFIASIAHDPDILFFDEPFAGLDPVSVDTLRDSIVELSESGKTILFSTHIMEQAEKLCHRIFLIDKGRQVVYGTLEEIKDAHGTNTVVVEFDGDGKIFDTIPEIKSISRYPRYVELTLEDGTDPDIILAAIVGKISIRRFEVVAPSLHGIFVDLVGNEIPTEESIDE